MSRIRVTPEQFQKKHADRLKASIGDIQAGVERLTVSPTELAAKKADKMLAGVQAAVQSGKWAARLRTVDLNTWRKKVIDKGIGRIAGGIDGAADKTIAFASQLLAFEGTVQDKIDKMPDLTLEDSVARASTWIREMSKFSRK